MIRKSICFLMSFFLIWTNFFITQEGSARIARSDYQKELHSHVDALYRGARQIESLLDKAGFNIDSLIDSLDFDAEMIVEFVTNEIRYQAYQGVLRGSEGTLVSRSGNALDQSLLLARLLKDAGYEARIVRGELRSEEATALVQTMASEANWPPFLDAARQAHLVLNSFAPADPFSSESARNELEKIVTAGQPYLSEVESDIVSLLRAVQGPLADVEAAQGPDAFGVALLSEQQDYFWVEYRIDHAGGWLAAHPAFGRTEPPTVEPRQYIKDEIPAELQHRVRLQAFVETQIGTESTIHTLMSPWERPAATAAYIPQTLTIVPVTELERDGQLDLYSAIAGAEFFALYVNGKLPPGGNVFSLDGLVGPPEALTGQGQFFGTVSQKGLMAVDALSTAGRMPEERESVLKLKRVWFEFSVVQPGGKATTVTRNILQTVEDGNRLINGQSVEADSIEHQLKAALFHNREIWVATGALNPEFAVAQWLTLVDGAKENIDKIQELESQGLLADPLLVFDELKPMPGYRALEFLAMANGSTGMFGNSASYLAEPMIVTLNRGILPNEGDFSPFEQMDILFNARRSIEFSEGSFRRSIPLSAAQGIWDTYLETVPSRAMEDPISVTSAFEQLSPTTEGLRYISPLQESALAEFKLDPSALALAKSELRAGYGLILPPGVASSNPAWWRVDAATGTVTGMSVGPGGYGGKITIEYVIKLVSLSLSLIFMIHGLTKCYTDYGDLTSWCCLIDTIFTAMLVALMTYVVAKLSFVLFGRTYSNYLTPAENAIAIQNWRNVGAIYGLMLSAPSRTLLKLLNFRVAVCGTITGS